MDLTGQVVLHTVTVRRHRADDNANDDTRDADDQEASVTGLGTRKTEDKALQCT